MKKYICLKLPACLILFFSFLVTENAFSQLSQGDNKMDTVSNATTALNGNSAYAKGITTGRAKSLVGTAFGLISLVLGWWAKSRSNQKVRNKKAIAIAALTLALISIVLSVLHLITSYNAALGSGSGKAGAFVALLLAIPGFVLGFLTLRPSNKS
jgi:hypothetical protein